ncbi:hypothetical protein RKD29_004911 [Streptomyces tendae]
MTEITGNGSFTRCDLRQRIPVRIHSVEVGEGAQYRSHIAELSGFARARCPSDADRCWSSGPGMRDNGWEAMCSMPVSRVHAGLRVPSRAVGGDGELVSGRGTSMAAMKPRTGDGPLEVTKEGRGIVMRVPLEGGGRLVVELTPDEADALGDALKKVVG